MTTLPLIGVSADLKTIDDRPYHAVGDKYVRAVAVAAGGAPLIIPAMEKRLDLPALVDRLDGIFLTGSPSNLHPRHYGLPPCAAAEPYDEARDELCLALIEQALTRQVPLLAVCRGFQELNVALGGTLHPVLHAVAGRADHRPADHPDPDVRYGHRHSVVFIPNGRFAAIAGKPCITVNSVHCQGVDRLADGLVAEGHAPDGTIEAISVKDAQSFALGVQWHPEYKITENAFAMRLFAAFGAAARERAATRPR